MTARSWILALGLTLLAFAPGCIVLTSTPNAAYTRCTSSCEAGTACINANTTVAAGATTGELFCSTSCVTTSDCPASPSGGAVTCVTANGSGQCYRACNTTGDCPAGFTCGGPAGMPTFCVPGTATTTTCGASGEACCAGNVCNAGLVCGTTSSGVMGICGVAASTCGASGQACCAGDVCDAGLTCGTTSSGVMGVCGVAAACGDVGQPCCTGSTCTAPGAVCGSNGACGLGPYAGCDAGSIGTACFAGQDSTGGVVATTCQQPLIPNPGPNGFCTALCAASQAECPQWVDAPRSYTYNCYILQGETQGQCFIDCPNGEACPANTVCAMTANSLGQQVRLCMPAPTG
jgi:hypothetical protein